MKKITWLWWWVAAFVALGANTALAEGGFLNLLGDIGGGIATGGLSTILGGITGVFGSWLNNRHQLKIKELDNTFQVTMMQENRATAAAEAKQLLQQTVVITEGAIDEALAKGRETAQRMANVPDDVVDMVAALKDGFWSFKWLYTFMLVNVYMVVKMIRPAVTIYMITAASLFIAKVFVLMEKQGDLDQILTDSGGALIMYTANALFYFIGVTIGYYFQERNRIKAPQGYAFNHGGVGGAGMSTVGYAPPVVGNGLPEEEIGGGMPPVVPAGNPPSAEGDEVPAEELP